MSLDTFVVSKVGHSIYEVKRYKAGALLESATVDLVKGARSDFENKRLSVARKYASEGCPKGSAYWFSETGAISKTKLTETVTDLASDETNITNESMTRFMDKKHYPHWAKGYSHGLTGAPHEGHKTHQDTFGDAYNHGYFKGTKAREQAASDSRHGVKRLGV